MYRKQLEMPINIILTLYDPGGGGALKALPSDFLPSRI